MSLRVRILLVILGLTVCAGALLLLVYVSQPVAFESIQATLQPTIFISP